MKALSAKTSASNIVYC